MTYIAKDMLSGAEHRTNLVSSAVDLLPDFDKTTASKGVRGDLMDFACGKIGAVMLWNKGAVVGKISRVYSLAR